MRYSIGLDISAGEIRLIQLHVKNPSVIEINLSAIEHFDADAIIDGRIKNPIQVSAALKHLIERTNIKNKRVSIALPQHCVIAKRLKLPGYLEGKEREIEILEHLKQYLPGIQEEVGFDFIEVGREDDLQELILFAARKSQLDAYCNIVAESGLKVSRVDLDVYAFMRGVKWHQSFTRYAAILHFKNNIQFTVVNNNEVIFTQYLVEHLSVSQLVHEIKSLLGVHAISPKKLEKIITLGEIPFNLDDLNHEFAINICRIEDSKKQLMVTPDFLIAFGLALGANHV